MRSKITKTLNRDRKKCNFEKKIASKFTKTSPGKSMYQIARRRGFLWPPGNYGCIGFISMIQRTKRWAMSGRPATSSAKKAKVQKPAEKVMLPVFWDYHLNRLPRDGSDHHWWVLLHTTEQTTWCSGQDTTRYGQQRRSFFFSIMHPLTYLQVLLRNHSDVVLKFCHIRPISLILLQATFYCLQNLKNHCIFGDLTTQMTSLRWLNNGLNEICKFYNDVLRKVEKRKEKCIDLNGDYVEKSLWITNKNLVSISITFSNN